MTNCETPFHSDNTFRGHDEKDVRTRARSDFYRLSFALTSSLDPDAHAASLEVP